MNNSIINHIVNAVACKIGDCLNGDPSLFSVLATKGDRDGKPIYIDMAKSEDGLINISDTNPFTAFHILEEIRPSTAQKNAFSCNDNTVVGHFSFYAFYPDGISDIKLLELSTKLGGELKLDFKRIVVDLKLVFWRSNWYDIIKSTWPDNWPSMQPVQHKARAVHIKYSVVFDGCNLC